MSNQFLKPGSVEEAIRLKQELGNDYYFLAGGTMLNSLEFNDKLDGFISLETLGLKEIKTEADEICIGAMVTVQELIESELVPLPLRDAARRLTNRNVRNIATIGGNLACKKDNSDHIALLLALDAKVELANKTLSVEEYLENDDNSLILSIRIPRAHQNRKISSRNHRRTGNEHSILTAAVSFDFSDGKIQDAIIAIGGVAKRSIRLKNVEAKLNGHALPDQTELEKMVQETVEPVSDLITGSAEFKRYMAGVLVAYSVQNAVKGEN